MSTPTRPNIVFVMSDDHAAHAIGAYGSAVASTPSIDRIAAGGMRFDSCFCANALCAPSRASILTGTYNHVNGVRTLSTEFDSSQPTFPPLLQQAGYQTAVFGKWHLGHGDGHDPVGFDDWSVLHEQGLYDDPVFHEPGGEVTREGYVTDVITDMALEWLDRRDTDRPFCLLVHHKAPHRPFVPAARHADLYSDVEIPEPETFWDDYSGRTGAAEAARMRVARDLRHVDLKEEEPAGLSDRESASWRYRRYMQDYLRCVAAVDEGVGRLLDRLQEEGIGEDTVVVYTSDQGFFLGDHGWYDKRFMYEESLRMPLLISYPRAVQEGSVQTGLVSNVDFCQTICDLAGVEPPDGVQGRSIVPLLDGEMPGGWRDAVYYRYWEHDDAQHGVWAHYGIRTATHKLIRYLPQGFGLPGTSEASYPEGWELFDLVEDPQELRSRYDDPDYRDIRDQLHAQLEELMATVGDVADPGRLA
ncbi:sulfatase family protein [Pseudactinotalea terrae]|uniref:sulfatase family protein n=1 Tax=Pseudactinotalea terrae TaxID=1743262 RepID=UPI0012E1B144|nr:sulfatase [Pseudactinotalea terrae]